MVLKKSGVWVEGYIPQGILYREETMSKLDYFLKPVLESERAHNILCIGDYGTGKTVSVRYKIQDLDRKQIKGFKYFYINCAEYAKEKKAVTLSRIITECLRESDIKVYSTLAYEIKLDIFKRHIQTFNSVILVLDEVDYYFTGNKNDFETLAYIISRSLSNVAVILITNKFWVPDYLAEKIDTRVQDTFSKRLKVIGFSDYTAEELFGILLDRAKIGFVEGSYTEDVLDYIAHLCFINGWRARGVINIAKEAAELADDQGDEMLEHRHVDEIAEILPHKELKQIIKRLDPPALNILVYLTKRHGNAIEGEVLTWFKEKSEKEGVYGGKSRTSFYNALSRLKGMELVESEIKSRGRAKGRYAILKIPDQQYLLVKESLMEFFEEQKKGVREKVNTKKDTADDR